HTKPIMLVFNKIDKMNPLEVEQICRRYNALGISALNKNTLIPLIDEIKNKLWEEKAICNVLL
ncbi:MAG: GTPase HflX, partial [Thermodesulfovibrio sp.]|nr:GTPase HflX [Thermodesulfovibrio sp.]